MIRLVLWSLAISLAVARGEVLERAYYVGTKEQMLSEMSYDGDADPFAEDNSESTLAAVVEITRLHKEPFESDYFSGQDRLWDVSSQFEDDSGAKITLEGAVFNESTGWLVLKGEAKEINRVDSDVRDVILSLPRSIQLNAKIFLVPRKSWGVSRWKVSELEKRHQSLFEAEVMDWAGMEAKFEEKGGDFKMRFSPLGISNDEVIDMTFAMSGTVKGYSFDLLTNLSGFNGVPLVIELGAVGNEKSLILVLRPDFYLPGGVKLTEAVRDDSKPLESPYERMIPPSPEERWPPDPKTGKVLRRFSVSPTFMAFLDSGGGDEDRFLLKSWNSKVKAGPGSRVYDLKPLLKGLGLVFNEGDFACLVAGQSGTVIAELDPKSMDLLDAIIAPRPGSPRIITLDFAMVEGEEKIEVSDLSAKNLKGRFKSGLVVTPGINGMLKLKNGDYSILLEPEAQVGRWDDVIDFQGKVVFKKDKQVLFEWNSGATLKSSKREIVSSYQKDGKWYALVVEARVEEMADWLLGGE